MDINVKVVCHEVGRVLLIILALFWVVLLAPVIVKRLRDGSGERSIDSFHAEHEVLSRQTYAVPPAHRLDRHDGLESPGSGELRRPRLTVVHADDTYRSLESRSSWDEWAQDYDYDDEPSARRELSRNRYAAAYSSVPKETAIRSQYEAPVRYRSMRSRRRVIFTRLVVVAVLATLIAVVSGYSIVTDLAVVSWVSVIGFIALALYAVSQGYLNESSLPVRFPQPRPLATVQPLYRDGLPEVDEEFASEYYEPQSDDEWQRESRSRRALG